MEFRGLMGGLYRISEWIMRFSAINVLWVICSSPVLIGGFFIWTSPAMFEDPNLASSFIRTIILYCAILSPFTLFPATAAMFAVARKWVMGDTDVALLKTYFRSYKENYKQSMFSGLFFVLLSVLLYVNYTFYLRQSGTLSLLSVLFVVLAFILAAAVLHHFSIMVHFHMKFWQIVKNSFLITIGNPVMTIFLLVCSGIILYVSLTKFTFLIPFFMASLIAFVSFWTFYRIYDRMKTLTEKKEQENEAEESNDEENNDEEERTDRETDKPDSPAGLPSADGQKPGDRGKKEQDRAR
ncbi:DUF624 domain-containing protein [Paenibacillus ginsengarvi]|uniref:DUF624 domain-containing protein n=2 Tax=Paenibacillus ginsengarvi TaxID=400777 RepID=A0A3B0CII7_9BACL|nr:DUF624 domain-containing protein [Paenibacillus ginsengarvi]